MRISDCSSDVCSSDLRIFEGQVDRGQHAGRAGHCAFPILEDPRLFVRVIAADHTFEEAAAVRREAQFMRPFVDLRQQIGRAACRERGLRYGSLSVVAVTLKTNKCKHIYKSKV